MDTNPPTVLITLRPSHLLLCGVYRCGSRARRRSSFQAAALMHLCDESTCHPSSEGHTDVESGPVGTRREELAICRVY